ncbi:MAG: GNAT family N-acetyltransferase [Propionibacteriaceae bacterium]|nr:GNAT family N-acetyltransferase [Propionibacteriaceae bacterium]
MTTRIVYNHARPTTSRLEELYRSVGWSTYLVPGRLDACLDGSLWFEAAWAVSTTLPTSSDGGSEPELVGLIRVVGDDASIAYVQDLLVKPDHQRRGIATRLMRDAFKRFARVRQVVLLTDDTAASRAFYESLGLVQVGSQQCVSYLRLSN